MSNQVPVTINLPIKGSHVLTMQEPDGKENPVIHLSWDEAGILARMFYNPTCTVPKDKCISCGLSKELFDMIKLRGPKS